MNTAKPPINACFALMDAAGLRDVDIARALGVTRGAVSRWRSGTRDVSPEYLQAFVALATGAQTRFLAVHRTAQGPREAEHQMAGSTYVGQQGHVVLPVMPDDPRYLQQMAAIFQHRLAQLTQHTAAPVEAWEHQAVEFLARELDGMARAITIIAQERKPPCPDSTPTDDGCK